MVYNEGKVDTFYNGLEQGDDASRYRWFSGEMRGTAFGGCGKNGIGSEISAMGQRKHFAFIRSVGHGVIMGSWTGLTTFLAKFGREFALWQGAHCNFVPSSPR